MTQADYYEFYYCTVLFKNASSLKIIILAEFEGSDDGLGRWRTRRVAACAPCIRNRVER